MNIKSLYSSQDNNYVNVKGDINRINFSIDDFKRIREDDFLYIDKTKLIEDILVKDDGKVLLYTRPRRFGKSLNLSMLRYYFDMTENSSYLFNDLYIKDSYLYTEHLNRYPVLNLNLKDASVDSIMSIHETICEIIENEIKSLYNKYLYDELKNIQIRTEDGYVKANKVKEITEVLAKKTGKRAIVLIDEYDSLLNRTYKTPHWLDAARVLKEIFGGLLKSNEYLQMGILTGVGRIGKELGFSDMNNLSVYGLTRERYYSYFGFTETEVRKLLDMNGIEMSDDFYRMYNGYHIGNTPNIFNTVSILKFLDDYHETKSLMLSPYWINSSSNSILKDNIRKMDIEFRNKLLKLLNRSTVIDGLFENIDFDSLDKPAHLLSLLIDVGYLCPIKKINGNLFEIKVPNEEVLYGYQAMVDSIVGTSSEALESLCNNLVKGDIERFEHKFNDILLHVSSFNDFSEKENSYHCLLEGALLYLLGRFHVISNREAGHGRFDICMLPNEHFKKLYKPIIIEFKTAKEKKSQKEYDADELLKLAETALSQIEDMEYYAEYENKYRKEDFLFIGIGTQGKSCKIVWK